MIRRGAVRVATLEECAQYGRVLPDGLLPPIMGGTSYRDVVLATAGLVSLWPLNESSGTTAADLKGPNSGTYTGSYTLGQSGLVAGMADTAVLFSGGYVALPNAMASDAHGSFECWVTTPSDGATNHFLFDARDSTNATFQYCKIQLSTGAYTPVTGSASASAFMQTGVSGTNHLVFTATGSAWAFYVNGVSQTVGTFSTPQGTWLAWVAGATNTPVEFSLATSRFSSTTSQPLNATMQYAAYYNVALSAATILQHYDAGKFGNWAPPMLSPRTTYF